MPPPYASTLDLSIHLVLVPLRRYLHPNQLLLLRHHAHPTVFSPQDH
jgi:hypothetical protein